MPGVETPLLEREKFCHIALGYVFAVSVTRLDRYGPLCPQPRPLTKMIRGAGRSAPIATSGSERSKRGGGDREGLLPNRLAAARARSWCRLRRGTTARQRADVALGHFGLTTRPLGRGGESPMQRRDRRRGGGERLKRRDDSCRAEQSPFGRAIERFVSERLQRGER
jgi:hypothetical protein